LLTFRNAPSTKLGKVKKKLISWLFGKPSSSNIGLTEFLWKQEHILRVTSISCTIIVITVNISGLTSFIITRVNCTSIISTSMSSLSTGVFSQQICSLHESSVHSSLSSQEINVWHPSWQSQISVVQALSSSQFTLQK